MPVHFKSTSEYKQKFGSFEFEDKSGPGAGIESDKLAITYDPPIQHKKRLDGPPTSLSSGYFCLPSRKPEYALLGQQEKFASNVRYQPKASASEDRMYKNKENCDDSAPPNKQLRMQKRIKPLIKERHPPVSSSPSKKSSKVTSSLVSPPLAPRDVRDSEDLKAALKDKDLKDVLEDKPSQTKEETKTVKAVEKSNMNEFVQTNMKKGVAVSAPEAPTEFALKYKAGVAPPRPLRKASEYQKQFQWKQGMKASPLLAAEQIVYKSNAELGPYKTDAIPKMSEYRTQFQSWKPMAYSTDDFNFNLNNNNNNDIRVKLRDESSKEKSVVKRSKSAGAVVTKSQQEIEKEQAADTEAAQVKEELKKRHGKIRRIGTEYRANFKPPTKFTYERGAWRGADPPQLMPQASDGDNVDINNNNNNNNNSSNEPQPLSTWFAEVIELRRRAEEYRRRAQGTHFSREHLVQLMAKQNECWDLQSNHSSTLSALNLEQPALPARRHQQPVVDNVQSEQLSNKATAGDSDPEVDADLEEGVEDEEQEKLEAQVKGKPQKEKKESRKSRKMAWLEEQKEKVADQRRKLEEFEEHRTRMEDFDEDSEGQEGRLPTPSLQQQISARRHHLDLTTPAVGGALLTCPPSKNNKMIVTSRSGDSYVTASDDVPAVKSRPQYDLEQLVTRPTLGQPSSDTHALRDEEAESDRPMVTRFISSPALVAIDDDKENTTEMKPQKKTKKSKKVPKPSQLSTVKEGYGKTYKKSSGHMNLADIKADQVAPKEDDVMSVSLMSVASSGSLASAVLERAKKRQQEFWGKKG